MDQQVLRAQKWVNEKYGSVAGYQRCPEDGRTGWSTMYSLTMGLQHELGISPVVASFGPGTYSRVEALGDIGFGWEENRDLLACIQFGMWCKGYWAVEPESEGWFTGVTREAVKELRSNMGLPEGDGVLNVKIIKAILNMDAYVVVAGGSEEVQGIQRWLNGRYWDRSAYSIGPADGIYSRDVQKSLMVALQYELGIAAPNGNYGPATQAGLRSHPVAQGDSGTLVQIFSAACVFNSPTYDDELNAIPTAWRSSFDDKLAEWVRAFQKFNKLEVNGDGDFQTWSQLLVSMGDPDRPATGSDTRYEITPSRAKWLKDNKYEIVGRYIYDPPGSTLDKEIKPGELDTIFSHGLRVFPIYQDNARELDDFTYANGYQHGLNAHELASGYGFNPGTTIYFAVDYDATQEAIDGSPKGIIVYFHGVQAALASKGKKYNHGVYGSRNVCINVTNKTFARYSFVSGMSWGFSGNLGFPIPRNWSFNQIKEFKVQNGSDTFDLDRDVISGLDRGVGSVNDQAGPADDFIAYVQKLYDLAGSYGATGQKRSQLVMEYIRHYEYGDKDTLNKIGWWYLIGGFDQGFVDYCNAQGMSIRKSFKDPFTGYDLGAEHMMATANAHLLTDQPSDRQGANGGDVGGWAGDLMTFWSDWRNSETEYADPLAFCHARLAVPGVSSSFGFNDLIEDADGYLIARAVRGNKTIVEAVEALYQQGGGGLTRFNDYFTQRWGNATDCKQSAHNALTASDTVLGPARKQLISLKGAVLPAVYQNAPGGFDKLQNFEQGFVDALLARMGMEKKKAAQYRANHEAFLKAARGRAAARSAKG
ncbi:MULTISPECIES: glycoside hydrolase domain-containing protein [unclassified Streptomyces]|uniref:glycoside hydrolase domain-containing protein n=1 Tax=unclassified Streptomyces TaxID=2593676 RepID=UPI002783425B|nr:glycoside hydrolase domain-containing protein [Streptomyces sp. DSM 40167]MDQ0405029.1 peptidoglycan hydrolase-like protein with peptidoglycan-binding domain [Streptomyces sp. DSM 40167]